MKPRLLCSSDFTSMPCYTDHILNPKCTFMRHYFLRPESLSLIVNIRRSFSAERGPGRSEPEADALGESLCGAAQTHTHIHTHRHTHTETQTHTRTHTYTHIHRADPIHPPTCTHTDTHTRKPLPQEHWAVSKWFNHGRTEEGVSVNVCVCVCVCVRARVCVCVGGGVQTRGKETRPNSKNSSNELA